MSSSALPLVPLGLGYCSIRQPGRETSAGTVHGRTKLWLGGLVLAALLYFGAHLFWDWKHPISSSGGRYFIHRLVIPVPAFSQGDPRWNLQLLGPTIHTVGQQGCALASAAMVLASYGIDTDPQRLNDFLTLNDGYTPNGWIYWEKAASFAPGRVEKAYEDLPSYALIDENLLAGNPVIVRLTLRYGEIHFVVLVGKQGWDYLIRDPARPASWGVYHLKDLTSTIEALRFYRQLPAPPSPVPNAPASAKAVLAAMSPPSAH